MIELGGGKTSAAPTGDLVRETSEATFMADVVDASQDVPVIVDFWAPWCGPCRTLGPALEAEVMKAGGKVKMVKINVDENQQIAAQLRIQSIPAVFAFFAGRPIDGFTGAISPAEIRKFVEGLIAKAGVTGDDGNISEAVEAAEQMLEEGAAVDAAQTFAAILAEFPDNAAAYAGLIRAHLALGEDDRAAALIDNAPEAIAKSAELAAIKARIELKKQAANTGPEAELRAKLERDEGDHQARLDLAVALHAAGKSAEAIDELLDLFRRDREWNDGAARAQLFKVFDSMKPQDPLVLKARRRLSSMIFA